MSIIFDTTRYQFSLFERLLLAFAAAYRLGDLSLEGGFVINVVHERFHALLFCITVGLHQSLQFHPGAVILLFL